MSAIMFNFSPSEVWLIVGFALLLVEFALPGIGLLFLGLGALSNAVMFALLPTLLGYQFVSFGLLSFLWFIILWRPLKKYVYKKNNSTDYADMLGNDAEVYGSDLIPGKNGQVKWSGTIMNAKLVSTEEASANVGEKVIIKHVQGNVAICSKVVKK